MAVQTTDTMYRRIPDDEDWRTVLPEQFRPLVKIPAWATSCYAEGWTDPETFAWLPEDTPDGVFSFYFAMKIARGVRVYSSDRGKDVQMRVSLTQAGHLTRQGGQASYRTEPLKVGVGFDDDDDVEMTPASALLLLEALGEALTPILPATDAEVRAERRRHLSSR